MSCQKLALQRPRERETFWFRSTNQSART